MRVLIYQIIVVVISVYCSIAIANSARKVKHQLKFYNGCALKRLLSDEDDAKIKHFWQNLLRPMLIRRVSGSQGNRDVQQHIIKVFSNLRTWEVDIDTFTEHTVIGHVNFSNIIATQKPEKLKKFTLACHFDSKLLDRFIGATDSAVPCAILLDLATNLDEWLKIGNGNQAKDYSLRLLFFDGEEAFKHWTDSDSLYGARHLAKKWEHEADSIDESKSKLDTIAALVLLDLIGEAGMTFHNYFQQTTLLFEALGKAEKKLAQEKLLISSHKMFSNHQLLESMYGIQDDHIPFFQRDVPILHLISFPFPSAWHTPSDTEDNLNWQEIDNINKIIRVFVAQFLHLKVKGCAREGLR